MTRDFSTAGGTGRVAAVNTVRAAPLPEFEAEETEAEGLSSMSMLGVKERDPAAGVDCALFFGIIRSAHDLVYLILHYSVFIRCCLLFHPVQRIKQRDIRIDCWRARSMEGDTGEDSKEYREGKTYSDIYMARVPRRHCTRQGPRTEETKKTEGAEAYRRGKTERQSGIGRTDERQTKRKQQNKRSNKRRNCPNVEPATR